jgi:tetratricopeptide (TPR) repeat protein
MNAARYTKGDVVNGKYEIHGVLGQGGFGVVYLIRMLNTGEAFAMKTFRDERMADLAAQEAFKKEALLWVNLEKHPCIVAAQWVEQVSGRLFVLMEHIAADSKGRVTLADHLAQSDRSLDTNQALEWGIQFCLGMEHAQSRGIKCHRDIKPGNILIAQGETLKISDFGLAVAAQSVWRGLNRQTDSALQVGADVGFHFSVVETEGKMTCGTPGYMPPEVYRGEGADVRSDIYSFGLVLWQMVMRNPKPPFAVPWRGDVEAYLRGTYEQQMQERAPLVDGPIATVINRCLNPKPQDRHGSFQELRGDLQPLFEQRAGRRFQIPGVGEKTALFWNNKGGSLAALGRHDEAIRCYDAALAIDPRAAQIWNNKGSALSALGRSEEAMRCFDQAVVIHPRFAMALDNKARELMVRGRHQDALLCYEHVLAIEPQYAETWQGKGIVLTKLERHDEALRCYDKALALDSKLANAWHNRGLTLLALQRDVDALECFDRALAINPQLLVALDRKAVALAALERYAEAVPLFEQVLALNPENANSWLILAQCRWACGDIKGQTNALNEALIRFQEAQKLGAPNAARFVEQCRELLRPDEDHFGASAANTDEAQEWFSKAAVLAESKKHAEAVSCYETGLKLDPNNAAAWFNMGHSIGFLGRHQDVVNCCDRALEMHPDFSPLWIMKGLGFLSMERFQDAMTCFQQAEKMGDTSAAGHMARCRMSHAEWYFRLGSVYQQEGNNAEAIRCYEKGLGLNPGGNAVIWSNKGAALLALKRNAEAVICFERAIALQPEDWGAWNNKGIALFFMEQYAAALPVLEEAQRLGATRCGSMIAVCRAKLGKR